MNKIIRTYPLKHAINHGKQEKIVSIVKEYRKLAQRLASLQWCEFFRNGNIDKNLDIKAIESLLSARYKQTCQYQVVGVLNSFLANRQNDFVRIVWRSTLDETKKRQLFYINKYRLYFAKTATMPAFDEKGKKIKGEEVEIPLENIRLARAIFKHILGKHRRPKLKRCNMALDNKVAQINIRQETEKKSAKNFDYWVTLSTLQKRKQIDLPLITSKYFEDRKGILKKFCQINVDEENRITICLIKEIDAAIYVPEVPKIALDFGLRNLFTSECGDFYGRNFIEMLKKYDRYITSLAQNRQRQKLKVKSRTYNALTDNLRNYLKNEIHRVLNTIVERYQPQEIVVEKLNFTSPQLSRSFNRLLSNMGRKIIKKKFESLSEEKRIIVTQVPAPYTSQRCSACGYVDYKNRKSQSSFVCRHCNKKQNADVNAAQNISKRSSHEKLNNIYLSKKAILDILIEEFIKAYPEPPTTLLETNPYFRRFREYGTTGSLKYG